MRRYRRCFLAEGEIHNPWSWTQLVFKLFFKAKKLSTSVGALTGLGNSRREPIGRGNPRCSQGLWAQLKRGQDFNNPLIGHFSPERYKGIRAISPSLVRLGPYWSAHNKPSFQIPLGQPLNFPRAFHAPSLKGLKTRVLKLFPLGLPGVWHSNTRLDNRKSAEYLTFGGPGSQFFQPGVSKGGGFTVPHPRL